VKEAKAAAAAKASAAEETPAAGPKIEEVD
jgi:hypothetical protein